jgi:hypothetical protein
MADPNDNPHDNPPADDKDKKIAELEAKLKELTTKPPTPPEDPDLKRKAELERESKEKKDLESKQLESALKFSLSSKEWLKNNSSLLPKETADIFTMAEKEKFDSAIDKDSEVKSGIVQKFFEIQANVDLLTPGQKIGLEDFLKLTKNGKREKAQQVYEMIFEPALEMLRRVKKAEALSGGFGNPDDAQNEYKEKLMKLSKKHYLGKE